MSAFTAIRPSALRAEPAQRRATAPTARSAVRACPLSAARVSCAPRSVSTRNVAAAALERPTPPSSTQVEAAKPLEELLEDCKQFAEEGTELTAKVLGRVKEGAKVEVHGVEAIAPRNLLASKTLSALLKNPDSLIGEELPVIITSVEDGVVTVDARKILEADSWATVKAALETESVLKATVTAGANAGAILSVEGLRAFLPGSRMNLERFVRFSADPKSVVGDNLQVLVQKVGDDYSLVVDERDASQKLFIEDHKEGEIVTGKVRKIFDYGVLVNLAGSAGSVAQGMIPMSELSWEFVATPEQVVQHGDVIQCKITKLHKNTRRVDLSLKQMEDDPLRETIDKVLPLDEAIEWENATVPVAGLDVIVDELLMEDGVEKVTLGRQAMQQRAVSQDMELYITRCEVEDGFNLVARAGRSLQELHVVTTLDRANMVGALGRVLKRVV